VLRKGKYSLHNPSNAPDAYKSTRISYFQSRNLRQLLFQIRV